MKFIITESQYKILKELSPKSVGVQEFIDEVEETRGLLKFLGFKSIKSLRDYIQDGDYDDFDELKKELKKFKEKK
jgi:hypothetical protein